MSEKMKAKAIKKDALIQIDVGATFYMRIQALMMTMVEEYGVDKATVIINRLKKDNDYKPESIFEENLVTVISFLYAVEKKADELGLMEDIEIDAPPSTP